MRLRLNHLRERLAAKQACRGVWLNLPSVASARLLARLPCDWLLVDTEHSPIDVTMMTAIVGAIADAQGPAPLVRVAEATVENIKHALDAGAWGVVAPMIETAEQATLVVDAAKYPPLGKRGSGSAWAPLAFGTDGPTYIREANEQTLAIVQIESRTALQNLDAILSVRGIDLAFVGPFDLSLSLGLPQPDWSHPVFVGAIQQIVETARRHEVPLGIYCPDRVSAAARIAQGFLLVNVASDVGCMVKAVRAELDGGDT